jgi:hypothetical protein
MRYKDQYIHTGLEEPLSILVVLDIVVYRI